MRGMGGGVGGLEQAKPPGCPHGKGMRDHQGGIPCKCSPGKGRQLTLRGQGHPAVVLSGAGSGGRSRGAFLSHVGAKIPGTSRTAHPAGTGCGTPVLHNVLGWATGMWQAQRGQALLQPGCALPTGLVTDAGAAGLVSGVGSDAALQLTSSFLPFFRAFVTGGSTFGCFHREDLCVHVPGDKHTDVNVRGNVNIYNNFPQLRVVLEQKISILGVGTSIL